MSVTSPAVSTWHRKLVGEMARRCIDVLTVYEELDCLCYLGKPPRTREPCLSGHCSNITDMPRTVLDTMFAYSEGEAGLAEIEDVASSKLCFSGPNWIKPLMTFATIGPKAALRVPSPFSLLDDHIAKFLERYA